MLQGSRKSVSLIMKKLQPKRNAWHSRGQQVDAKEYGIRGERCSFLLPENQIGAGGQEITFMLQGQVSVSNNYREPKDGRRGGTYMEHDGS